MVRNVITTIEAPEILLIAGEGIFRSELEKALEALHFTVRAVSPEGLEAGGGIGFSTVLQNAFAVVWVDTPLFSHQSKKKDTASRLVDLLSKDSVPLWFVCFDLSHTRRKNQVGTDPTWGSAYLLHTLKQKLPKAHILEYLHAIYPFEEGLSFVQRFVVEKIQKDLNSKLSGEFSPIWYQDVIADLVQKICASHARPGMYSGAGKIEISEFEAGIRKALQYSKQSSQHQEFPYQFEEGKPLNTRSILEMVEEIALSLPKKRLFSPSTSTPAKTPEEAISVVPKKMVKKRKPKHTFPLSLKTLFFGLFSLAAVYLICLIIFVSSLYGVKASMRTFVAGESTQEKGAFLLEQNKQTLERIQFLNTKLWIPYSTLGFAINRSDLDQVISGLLLLSEGLEEQNQGLQSIGKAYERTISEDSENGEKDLEQAGKRLSSAHQQLSSAQARLVQNGSLLEALFGQPQLSEELLEHITVIRESNTIQQSVISIWKEFLLSGKKNIALVLVDDTSPRPIGGIPRSVSILSLDMGKLLLTKHYSVAELDAMLTGTAEAPLELKDRYSQENWKLIDGTFSIDGPTASKQVAWFLSKQLREEVDAVWILTPQALERMLPSFSSPQVNNIRLTSKNLSSALNEFSTQYASGNTSGWEGMGKLVVEELLQAKGQSLAEIAASISEGFTHADIMVFIKDQGLSATLSTLGWDGNLKTPSCPTTFVSASCRVEHAYVFEYGLRGEAVSPFIERMESHDVAVTSQGIEHVRSTQYKNTATSDVWPQGSFHVYLKFVTNNDSEIKQVQVGNEVLGSSQYSVSTEFDKQVISFEIEVLTQSTLDVKVSYTSPPLAKTNSSLVVYEQKQIGKKASPLSLKVSYSDPFYAKTVAPVATIQKRQVVFDTILDEHRIFALGF